jgi:hypothetical protein
MADTSGETTGVLERRQEWHLNLELGTGIVLDHRVSTARGVSTGHRIRCLNPFAPGAS